MIPPAIFLRACLPSSSVAGAVSPTRPFSPLGPRVFASNGSAGPMSMLGPRPWRSQQHLVRRCFRLRAHTRRTTGCAAARRVQRPACLDGYDDHLNAGTETVIFGFKRSLMLSSARCPLLTQK